MRFCKVRRRAWFGVVTKREKGKVCCCWWLCGQWLLEWTKYSIIMSTHGLIALFIYIYIYIFSVGGGGIWTPDVSVGNTMKCQLCYKALGIVDSLTLTLLWLNKRPNKRLSCNKRLKYYLHPLSLRPLLNLPLNYLNVQSTHSGITTMLTCPFCQNALNLQVFNKITYLPFITKLTVTQKKKKKINNWVNPIVLMNQPVKLASCNSCTH